MARPKLTPKDAARLAKVLGMVGSAHDGERAAAALRAGHLVRAAGLTWQDVIAGPARPAPPNDEDHRGIARWALSRGGMLDDQEMDFLKNMACKRARPTSKRAAWLRTIIDRLRAEDTA